MMTDITISIRVIDSGSNPRSNIEVHVTDYANIGGSSYSEYTDSDGWASFTFFCVSSSLKVEVYVDGNDMGKHTFYDGDTASYTI